MLPKLQSNNSKDLQSAEELRKPEKPGKKEIPEKPGKLRKKKCVPCSKNRRSDCDLQRPSCGRCLRTGVACSYDANTPLPSSANPIPPVFSPSPPILENNNNLQSPNSNNQINRINSSATVMALNNMAAPALLPQREAARRRFNRNMYGPAGQLLFTTDIPEPHTIDGYVGSQPTIVDGPSTQYMLASYERNFQIFVDSRGPADTQIAEIPGRLDVHLSRLTYRSYGVSQTKELAEFIENIRRVMRLNTADSTASTHILDYLYMAEGVLPAWFVGYQKTTEKWLVHSIETHSLACVFGFGDFANEISRVVQQFLASNNIITGENLRQYLWENDIQYVLDWFTDGPAWAQRMRAMGLN